MKKTFTFLLIFLIAISNILAQNVGIGITNPTRAKLEVNGAVDATTAIFGGESSGISLQRNWPGVGFNSYWNGGNRALATGYSAKFHFDPNGGHLYMDMLPFTTANSLTGVANNAITINSSGYVGIGVATPNAPLQFANTVANRKIVLWETASNNHQFYGLGIESGTMRYSVAGTDNVHRFYAGTSAGSSQLLMSIWGNKQVLVSNSGGGGFLGINVDNAPYSLTIKQAGGTGIYVQESASLTNWHLFANYYFPNSNSSFQLHYQGSYAGHFRESGEYVWGSDSRLKTNVQNMPPTLGRILQLKPKVYEMIANNPNHEKTFGFIAQEVKALFPELVFTVENSQADNKGIPNLQTLSYAGLSVIAVKGLQDQQELINGLQKRMQLLEEQNKMLIQLLKNKN